MDWKDLPLTVETIEQLRNSFGFEQPEELVKLAWGAPLLLERVLAPDQVERLRDVKPFSGPQDYTSWKFGMGAQFGAPAALSQPDDEFSKARDLLIQRLERAQTSAERSVIDASLQDLYTHSRKV